MNKVTSTLLAATNNDVEQAANIKKGQRVRFIGAAFEISDAQLLR